MNDLSSYSAYRMTFYFDIPEALCQTKYEDDVDLHCNPGVKYDRALYQKWITILSNQKRLVSDNYDGKGHIIKETTIEWIPFPRD